ncbi:MAG: 3-methyl-2-oxobutanoate hydroxymethyltransferase [Cyanobacteria bacterium]|nr:3-methyl-2-oxobutanoate hydroxymethyltransferase [Cyanobacteriota bacterium]
MENQKVTIKTLLNMKANGEKITMLTGYDFLMASLLDQSGIDVILVGDSVGNVLLGYDNTIPVTMDEMIHHCKTVTRGAKRALVVGDMPFMSYQVSMEEALKNAGRFMKEANVGAVKLEGGEEVLDIIKKFVAVGIPVMGHLGLTPQSVNVFGGYGLRGSTIEESEKMINDAKKIEEAGAFAIVLEKIPADLAGKITETLKIPTIGIGAGVNCDGQVLVTHDMLGLFEKFTPKFSKRYAEMAKEMKECFKSYIKEVKNKEFPAKEHSY